MLRDIEIYSGHSSRYVTWRRS